MIMYRKHEAIYFKKLPLKNNNSGIMCNGSAIKHFVRIMGDTLLQFTVYCLRHGEYLKFDKSWHSKKIR